MDGSDDISFVNYIGDFLDSSREKLFRGCCSPFLAIAKKLLARISGIFGESETFLVFLSSKSPAFEMAQSERENVQKIELTDRVSSPGTGCNDRDRIGGVFNSLTNPSSIGRWDT